MAPRNKAKRQQGSFLTRGRQQVQRRQQLRQQSSRQLPPQGGTSAGSPKATAQRVTKAVTERARLDVARTRALADMMQRNVDRNARAEGVREGSRMTSGRTRYVPPGGENARGPRPLPPGQRGGDMRQRGGPLATTQRGGEMTQRGGGVTRTNNGGPVNPVQVRDMGNTNRPRINPGKPAALPASQRLADAKAKQEAAARGSQGPNRVGQPAGSANRVYGANRVNAAVARAQRQSATSAALRRGTVATSIAGALLNAPEEIAKARRLMSDPKGAVRDVAKNMGITMFDGQKGQSSDARYQTQFPQARRNAEVRVNRIKAGIPDPKPQTSTPQRGSSTSASSSRSSSNLTIRGSSASTRSSSSPTPKPPTERRVSASTANRESGNYGTSGTNNKLIDSWMRDRMRQRESAANEAAMTDAEKSKLAEINKKKQAQKK